MTEFIMGVLIGSMLIFAAKEYQQLKAVIMEKNTAVDKNTDSLQWANLMNYNGTVRGQITVED